MFVRQAYMQGIFMSNNSFKHNFKGATCKDFGLKHKTVWEKITV